MLDDLYKSGYHRVNMKDELLISIQMQPLQGVTVDPSVRRDLEATCRTLRIDKRILPVKEFRDELDTLLGKK